MEYSGAGGKLIHEKNQKQKISLHCPFKELFIIFVLSCPSEDRRLGQRFPASITSKSQCVPILSQLSWA